jgi:phenylalanyl-tRNA synthetase alpha chain
VADSRCEIARRATDCTVACNYSDLNWFSKLNGMYALRSSLTFALRGGAQTGPPVLAMAASLHMSLLTPNLFPKPQGLTKSSPAGSVRFASRESSSEGVSVSGAHRVERLGLSLGGPRKTFATAASAVEVGGLTISREDVVREDDPANNVPDSVFAKIGMQLHTRDEHPLGILKNAIYGYFDEAFPGLFQKFDNLSPIVSVKANFDDVLTPPDHVSRSYNDTYYVDSGTVLRCHTRAHQAEMLREGHTHFLVTGDVYRRDAIDATHYPVFHQMEGFRVFTPSGWEAAGASDGTTFAAQDLKKTLEGLARRLFGEVEMRWVDCYFPFTEPSFELEIYFQGKWMEVLGCGVTEQAILKNNGRDGTVAWAFGLGLERLAMVLFDIPDIRLFWSNDSRFTSQFKSGQLGMKFKPYSKYPPCYKDISFWISEQFTENNLCEVVRGIAGDLAEEVVLLDEFTNPKKGLTSHCYRIAYRSMERSLTDDEINELQVQVREQVESKLKVTLR